MAGGLHGLDMIKQLRNNTNLRKLNYFKKGDSKSPNGDHLEIESVSEEVRASIQKEIRASNRDERKRKIRTLVLASFITIFMFALLFFFLRF